MRRIVVLASVAIVGILAVSWTLYRRRVRAELDAATARTAALAAHVASTFDADIDRAARDLRLLSGLDAFRQMIDRPTPETLALARRDFGSFAHSHPDYFQIRYLDATGREVIRFDTLAHTVIAAETLQDKSDRYYWKELARLPERSVYVSPLDWNVEFGRREEPGRPTLRFGVREASGAVLLNADARVVLRSMREASAGFSGRIRLTDAATGRVIVEAAGGEWTFFPESPARAGPDDIVREASVERAGQAWRVVAILPHAGVAAEAVRGFRDQFAATGLIVLLLAGAAAVALRAERLRAGRALLIERTRLATVGEMAPAIAHELRNPLQAMLTAARTLRSDVSGEDGRRLLDVLTEEIVRLDRIAGGLLADGRRSEPTDVAALARRVVDLLDAGRSERPLPRVHRDLPDAPAVAVAPADTIKQVLWNVLLNACEAAGPRGNVWVRVAREDGRVTVDVEDDGPGLSAPKPDGHGIGLVLSDRLAALAGGALEITPSPRGGARARLALPVEARS